MRRIVTTSVRKEQFQTVSVTGIILNVQDNLSRNFVLQIGSSAVSVTVMADQNNINTTDGSVSTVVDRQFAENLPLNGRSFQTLIQLTPGVVVVPVNLQDAGQFSVNGQRASSNYWMVDGVSANIGIGSIGPGNGMAGAVGSFSAFGGTNSLVSVDALQEFRIQTSTYAPEFGRTPGGQISILTRSGANQLHGTAFDYLRNDVFDANDWFADGAGLPKPQERQNDFGGTFSGPILKNRTFFFFSYEGLRLRLPQVALSEVPCDSTCKVFGNARTSAVPAMEPFLNAYPLPNGPEVLTPCTPNVNGCPASGEQTTGAAQFNSSFSNRSTLDATSIRIDHKLYDKLTIFGRYNYSPSTIVQRAGGGTPLNTVSPEDLTTQTATVGVTWSLSPSAANDLRFNYSKTESQSFTFQDTFGGAVPNAALSFPSPFGTQNGNIFINIFSLGNYGFSGQGKGGHNLQRQINIVDSIAEQKGSHSLKFGMDFRRLNPLFDAPLYSQNTSFFTVSSSETGNLFFGNVLSTQKASLLFRNLGIFAQDTWRVLPRLTITYGVRWDVDIAPAAAGGPNLPAVSGFNLNDLSALALASPNTPPFKTKYDNFAPRIGMAYQLSPNPNRQSVLRGGFGIFYDLATSEAGNMLFNHSYPFGASRFCLGSFQLPGCPSTETFPLDPVAAAPPIITTATLSSGSLSAFDPDIKLPYTLQWNIAFEQSLGRQQNISASYVGSVGRRLIQTTEITAPNPSFGFVILGTNAGTSDYNALQIQFQRRLSHGLQSLASYTWSHSLDTGSAGSAFGNVANALVPSAIANSNRGPSDFDIRNVISAAVTYDVPAPKINAFTNAILRGWSLQSVVQARSAPPVDVAGSVINGVFLGSTLDRFFLVPRPDVASGQPLYLYGSKYPGGKAFNPSAFIAPPTDPSTGAALRNGNLGRNALRGFGATQWDFAIHRDFPIHESLKLQFRAEMFNVINHPNFGQPDGNLANPTFGQSTQMLGRSLSGGQLGNGGLSPLYQIGGPRSIQLALKLQF